MPRIQPHSTTQPTSSLRVVGVISRDAGPATQSKRAIAALLSLSCLAIASSAALAQNQFDGQPQFQNPGQFQNPVQVQSPGRFQNPAQPGPSVLPGRFQNRGSGSFSGIGEVGSNIDLLSNPARDRVFATPAPTYSRGPSPWPCPIPRPPYCAYPIIIQPYPYCVPRPYCGPFTTSATGSVTDSGLAVEPGYSYEVGLSSGSGLSVRGLYQSGPLQIGLSLGGRSFDDGFRASSPACLTPTYNECNYKFGNYWPTPSWQLPWIVQDRQFISGSYLSGLSANGPSTYGLDPRLSTNAPIAEQNIIPQAGLAPNYTPLEIGVRLIALGQPADAARALQADVTQNGPSALGLRCLALAHAQSRDWDKASDAMLAAYRLDPTLGERPLDIGIFAATPFSAAGNVLGPSTLTRAGLDAPKLRDLVRRAVVNANREKSPRAWLLVAALMQAQGRTELALSMAQRAKSLGLDSQVADSFAGPTPNRTPAPSVQPAGRP